MIKRDLKNKKAEKLPLVSRKIVHPYRFLSTLIILILVIYNGAELKSIVYIQYNVKVLKWCNFNDILYAHYINRKNPFIWLKCIIR